MGRSFVQRSRTERNGVCVCVCVCVIVSYQMQQSPSTSKRVTTRGQTKKERKLNIFTIRLNKLEQAMMLLTCIRGLVLLCIEPSLHE
jgi:hypothetical protein